MHRGPNGRRRVESVVLLPQLKQLRHTQRHGRVVIEFDSVPLKLTWPVGLRRGSMPRADPG